MKRILREEVLTKLIFNSIDKGNKFVMTNTGCGSKEGSDRSYKFRLQLNFHKIYITI